MKNLVLTLSLAITASITVQARQAEPPLVQANRLMDKAVGLLGNASERSLQEARELAERAKSIFAKYEERDMKFLAARIIAVSYNDEGRHEESRHAAQAMLEDARRANTPLWEASALCTIHLVNRAPHWSS